jgi:hypothetical protein
MFSTIAGGLNNQATQTQATVGGGGANHATAQNATIAGGNTNRALANGATVGGGSFNRATGDHATIAGGENDTASAQYATVSGGYGNLASNGGATVSGGINNKATGANSTVSGGQLNQATGVSSTVGGGTNNQATNLGATVSGGSSNQATQWNATVSGGFNNRAVANYATIPGGEAAAAVHYGEMAYASGSFAPGVGNAQTSLYVLRQTTSSNTLTELFLDGAGQRLTLSNNRTVGFDVFIVGRASDGTSAAYRFQGAIENDAGVVSLVCPVQPAMIANCPDPYPPGWNVVVDDDPPNFSLRIRAAGGTASTPVRWVAVVRTVEVGH